MTETLDRFDPEQVKLVFSFGYPLDEAGYDIQYDDEGLPVSVHVIARLVKLYLDGPALLETGNRRPIIPNSRIRPSPNGFSGAPVLFLALDGKNNARLGFAGMITNARPGRYMIYDSLHIRQIADQYIEDD